MMKCGWCALFLIFIITICTVVAPAESARSLKYRRNVSPNYLLISSSTSTEKYAVIFDAGSTGSRVHVFRFDRDLNLLQIGNDFEFYLATSPGLSSYADDPDAAAQSLKPLLDQAEAVVPQELRPQTPVRVGATAGLRQLSGDTSERILQAVRELLKSQSNLYYKAEWVSILDGFQEGSYMWVAINYLLGNLGQEYSSTVGVVDLGGGSVQMAYAISEEAAQNAPKSTLEEDDEYVQEKDIKGTKYYLYAHSYLNYGLNAIRAGILNLTGGHGNPCVINGYQGTYEYSGEVYKVSPPPSGTSIRKCLAVTRKALNLDANCPYNNCTFNGVWSGGGGDGQKNLYVASFFYDTAAWADIVDQSTTSVKIRPMVYLAAAKSACATNVNDIKAKYPHLEDRNMPFLCMDLVYLYALLVDGFDIDPLEEVTAVQKIEYKGSEIGAAWPLGCAVDVLSPSKSHLLD
ncbi:Nucleoside phosphatase [Handroanthus impetiginosus]|uniref:Nucleoside phosphatase n=1 Tax=Handroanthus impetiginosus TaxID=429701 RepID=A0A2G9H8T7_9LAMI|nr:Nucleoside phosphatase [Handroanthus impetiginosus]